MLASANRDPAIWDRPDQFDPSRAIKTNTSFGGGIHFCVGAPLARLEMKIALPALFNRLPQLHIAAPPKFATFTIFTG